MEQAVERHPKLADRLAEAVATGQGDGRRAVAVPGAPDPNPTDPPGDGPTRCWRATSRRCCNGDPGSGGPIFDVTALGNEVVVTRDDGVSVTLTEPDLESVAQGLTPPPPPIAGTPVVNQGGLQNLVGGLLGLLNP